MLQSKSVKHRLDALIVVIFILVSSAALFMWRDEKMHTITGDEPHYLVIADGLLPTFELEQTGPYTREFRNRTIVSAGLAPSDAAPSPDNTHTVEGPRGLFNIHNIGLPILIAVPYAIGGEVAARLMMIAIGAAAVFLVTRFLALSPLSPQRRFLIAMPLSIAMPLVPAATQIYPDLPGGVLALLGIYMVWKGADRASPFKVTLTAIAIAYMPWIHIRYSLPMGLILLAMSFQWRNKWSPTNLLVRLWLPAVVSVVLLALYNIYAFGNPTGPYSSGDVMFNRIAIMQFIGLLFDQNQGILLQQPLHFVGVFMIGYFLRQHFLSTLLVMLILLSTLGPNATHWNLYGGWSFSGRFGWTATMALLPLTAYGMAQLWERRPRAAMTLLVLGGLVQLRYMYGIFVQKTNLLPRTFDGWIGTYATFWGPFETWLPQWRDFRWAYSYLPNYMFLIIGVTLVILGREGLERPARSRGLVLTMSLLPIMVLGLHARLGDFPYPQQKWAASTLPSQIGIVENLSRRVVDGETTAYLTYGPYFRVPSGSYELGIRYSSMAETPNIMFETYLDERRMIADQWELPTTNGVPREEYFVITVTSDLIDRYEFRTSYLGEGEATIDWISLRKLDRNIAE